MLVVKTGMSSEKSLATRMAAKDVVVLSGIVTVAQLQAAIPAGCEGIISIGLAGGLAPGAKVAECYICDTLVTPDGTYKADVAWRQRLWARTQRSWMSRRIHFNERPWWSSGEFNTANSVAERAALFARTGCWLIDDETFAVAKLAKLNNIPFQALRAISDGTESELPKAVTTALNPDGTPNLRALLGSLVTGMPFEDAQQVSALGRVAQEYEQSMAALADAMRWVGPYFAFK